MTDQMEPVALVTDRARFSRRLRGEFCILFTIP
jgi:hypothetical protein